MNAAGFEFRLRAPDKYITIEDFRQAARRRLPKLVWAFLDGGAEDEVTLNRNRTAFCELSLAPHVLTGARTPDLSANVCGVPLKQPVLFAPTGLSGMFQWEADILAAKAAAAKGTRFVVSTSSSWSIEEIADASSVEPFFQLYPKEGDLAASLMKRAWAAGYRTLFLTVDVQAIGNREGERRTGMGRPPIMTPARLTNILRYPGWLLNALVRQRTSGRNLVDGGSFADTLKSLEIQSRKLAQATLDWEDFAWVRDQWKGRLLIKGVLNPEDAARAVDAGADGVVVSNHGGRQLDFAPAAISALPAIAKAVGGRADILLDSGVRRGSDVVKAIALGATAVMVGRPYLYGIVADGQSGAERVLDIFAEETTRVMTLMGVGSLCDLHPGLIASLRESDRQGPETEMPGPMHRFPERTLRTRHEVELSDEITAEAL